MTKPITTPEYPKFTKEQLARARAAAWWWMYGSYFVGTNTEWTWQDGSQHTWQDGTDATWQ